MKIELLELSFSVALSGIKLIGSYWMFLCNNTTLFGWLFLLTELVRSLYLCLKSQRIASLTKAWCGVND